MYIFAGRFDRYWFRSRWHAKHISNVSGEPIRESAFTFVWHATIPANITCATLPKPLPADGLLAPNVILCIYVCFFFIHSSKKYLYSLGVGRYDSYSRRSTKVKSSRNWLPRAHTQVHKSTYLLSSIYYIHIYICTPQCIAISYEKSSRRDFCQWCLLHFICICYC